MSRRAKRRHHYQRIKERWRKRLWRWNGGGETQPSMFIGDLHENEETHAAIRATTRTICSCAMCGNQRRQPFYGNAENKLTIQERRAFQERPLDRLRNSPEYGEAEARQKQEIEETGRLSNVSVGYWTEEEIEEAAMLET